MQWIALSEKDLATDTLEKRLWAAADQFRASSGLSTAQYSQPVLGFTQFRIWATQKLREFIVKGFVLDDERLKSPDQPFDYFEELLLRIQDTRGHCRRGG